MIASVAEVIDFIALLQTDTRFVAKKLSIEFNFLHSIN